ncbi:acyl carrier protein [Bacillus cereus group sp. N21]|uniref:acyl carrier protein n=1 Tax=Bacillus cereus group sp. N21 TaxID=2794591 RepID=UPI0018F612BE|nr:acyl carrier protein [Bacillus cereus group sp. N21]MBJ8030420.1 acyl carrier protein [Bacillus cereus group sp. N21]
MEPQTKDSIVQIITDKLVEILELKEPVQFNENLSFYGLDSIMSVQLIVELEDYYNIAFEDEELIFSNFDTVSKIVELIEGKI